MTSPTLSPRGRKAKGNAAEAAVVMHLRANGFPKAARTLAGERDDRGDVSGISAALQVKNQREFRLSEWMREAAKQADNAGLTRYAVVVKPPRVTDPADYYAVIPFWLLTELLMEDA